MHLIQRPAAPMRRLSAPALTLPLIVAALLAAGCGPREAPKAAAAQPAETPAVRLLLHAEDLLTVQTGAIGTGPVITGSIQPARNADLRAEVAAVVLQVLRDNGDRVRAGELLMKLDDTALRDNLASAEEAARAASEAVTQGERQVQRLETLRQQGMVSAAALEDAEIRRTGARSDLAAARARVVVARQQLQRTLVRAPFDGLVSDRRASVGDTVLVGRELLKVIDPASMRFEGLVSADRVHELGVGQKVSFSVNGYPGIDFQGTVRRLDAAANATTRQLALVVSFDDPTRTPTVAGLFAEGFVATRTRQALTVPERTLQREGADVHVWRVDPDALHKVAVRLGDRDPRTGDWPVLEGLQPGDKLLRNPGSQLRHGQPYEIAPSPGAASAAAVAATAAR